MTLQAAAPKAYFAPEDSFAPRDSFAPKDRVAPMDYFHERYFGRPSCPKCGELMMAPEYPEFSACRSGDEIRHFWVCDGCANRFDTLIKFKPAAA